MSVNNVLALQSRATRSYYDRGRRSLAPSHQDRAAYGQVEQHLGNNLEGNAATALHLLKAHNFLPNGLNQTATNLPIVDDITFGKQDLYMTESN
jgi:hypothetical protein